MPNFADSWLKLVHIQVQYGKSRYTIFATYSLHSRLTSPSSQLEHIGITREALVPFFAPLDANSAPQTLQNSVLSDLVDLLSFRIVLTPAA